MIRCGGNTCQYQIHIHTQSELFKSRSHCSRSIRWFFHSSPVSSPMFVQREGTWKAVLSWLPETAKKLNGCPNPSLCRRKEPPCLRPRPRSLFAFQCQSDSATSETTEEETVMLFFLLRCHLSQVMDTPRRNIMNVIVNFLIDFDN